MNQSRQDKYGHIMFDLETLDNKIHQVYYQLGLLNLIYIQEKLVKHYM